MSRLLPVALLALVLGLLTQVPAKPPDLPVDTTVTCAVAQEPEMPIDGLLVESTFEKPQCLVCDILMDVFFPPLRLRHIPAIMRCPCFKACCEGMQKTLAHCCESIQHIQAAAQHQQGHPSCPFCPSSGRCHDDQPDATENAGAQEEAEAPGDEAAEPEVLEVMPKEEPGSSDADAEDDEDEVPPAKAASHAPVCPYLQKKTCPPQEEAVQPEAAAKTPLDSFDRLMKALHLYRRGEHCEKAGKIARACHLYERAKKLCPGSRIDRLASTRLEHLYAQKAVENAQPAVEEAEPLPCKPAACGQHDQLRATCMMLVDELRAKASELLEEGHYAEGYELAEMAIKLSTDFEAAFTLLVKAHAALHASKDAKVCPETRKAEEPANETEDQGEQPQIDASAGEDTEVMPPAEEPTEPPDCGPQTLVQPQLPPVDPAIVDALEKVLREVGDPGIPKLVVEVDEPAADEQADPVSTWPYEPPQTDVPQSLLVDPDEDDQPLDEDDDAIPSPEDQAWAYVGEHLEDMLRGTVEALRQHVCCDVDIDGPFGPRGRVNFQVGAVQCTLVCDGWGHRLVVVRLVPEATGDLRDLQQAHNDRVLHWIEVMNSGGNSCDDDTVPSEDDDEDSDLLYYDDPNPV